MRIAFLSLFAVSVFLLLAPSKGQAQLSNGSIAPDFTVMDIDGETHNLYELLDQGKSVILDFFATWCGPCWSYHQTHHLEDIWQYYGPNGTDEVAVFYVEAYPFTDIEDLRGNGDNTLGDYTEGVSYPILDAHSLLTPYHISYWPTVYMICPNKRVQEVGQVTKKDVEKLLNDCPAPTGVNNGEILGIISDLNPICQGEIYRPKIRFQNTGANPISHATFDLNINGQSIHEDCQWQGYLDPFTSTVVDFELVELDGDSEIEIAITAVNGILDEVGPHNKVIGHKMAPSAPSNDIRIEVMTDNFGYEVYWELRGSNSEVIASGGNDLVVPGDPILPSVLVENPNGYYESNQLYTQDVSLPYFGCYEFYIIDNFRDGICCDYGDGYYRILDEDGAILLEGGENFYLLEQCFEVTYGATTASNELQQPDLNLQVFPNPADDWLQISTTVNAQADLRLYNAQGQLQQYFPQLPLHESPNIDISQLSAGLYYIHCQVEGQEITKKIVVE